MKEYLLRAAILAFAIALTLVVFDMWGEFGRVLSNYLTATTTQEPAKPSGVVIMKIIPPKSDSRPDCGKDKNAQCPKP